MVVLFPLKNNENREGVLGRTYQFCFKQFSPSSPRTRLKERNESGFRRLVAKKTFLKKTNRLVVVVSRINQLDQNDGRTSGPSIPFTGARWRRQARMSFDRQGSLAKLCPKWCYLVRCFGHENEPTFNLKISSTK